MTLFLDPQTAVNTYKTNIGAVMPNWLMSRSSKEISFGAKTLYARLQQYQGASGAIWPKLSTLADEIGVEERQVQNLLAELRDLRLIRVIDRRKESKTNEYEILAHPWWQEAFLEHLVKRPELAAWRPDLAQEASSDPSRKIVREGDEGSCVSLTQDSASLRRESGEKNQGRESVKTTESELRSPGVQLSLTPASSLHAQNDLPASNKSKDPAQLGPVREAAARMAHGLDIVEVAKAKAAAAREAQQQKSRAKEQSTRNLASKGDASNYELSKLLEKDWRAGFASHFPDMPVPKWLAKERGQANKLMEHYSFDEVERTLKWAVKNWNTLNSEYFKGKYDSPSLGLILVAHETVFAAAASKTADKFADLEKLWLENLHHMHPDIPVARGWSAAERSKVQSLVDSYDRDTVEALIVYATTFWQSIKETFFKSGGDGVPTLDTLVRFHAQWVPRAVTARKYADVIREYDAFGDEYAERPEALSEAYIGARKELRALGVIK